jgi:hypothetical protein
LAIQPKLRVSLLISVRIEGTGFETTLPAVGAKSVMVRGTKEAWRIEIIPTQGRQNWPAQWMQHSRSETLS